MTSISPALARHAPRSLVEIRADLCMEIEAISDEMMRIECFRDTNLPDGDWEKLRKLSERRGELCRQLGMISC